MGGLYSGSRPPPSGRTGEIDQALVRDLTPAGRKRLQELKQTGSEQSYEALAVEFSAGGEDDQATAKGSAGDISLSTSSRSPSRLVVVLQIDTSLLVIRNEMQRRRDRRLNDDPELQELEEFESQVEGLRATVVDVQTGKERPDAVQRSASSFGSWLRNWFSNHDQALIDGFDSLNGAVKVGLFMSATAVCASLGANVTLAATISGVLIGGCVGSRCDKGSRRHRKRKKRSPMRQNAS